MGKLSHPLEAVDRPHPDPVLAGEGQLAPDELGQGGIRLEDDLGRAWSHVVDVTGQRQPRSADVGHGERAGRQGVEDEAEVLDVLERQQPRVVELHVRLGGPVEDHRDPTAVVADELAARGAGCSHVPPSACHASTLDTTPSYP